MTLLAPVISSPQINNVKVALRPVASVEALW